MNKFSYLFKHYLSLWRVHWRNRKQTALKNYTVTEADFLPDALALQEKPLHPLPHIILWLIISFFLLALIWAFAGKTEIISTANGKVIPGGKSKLVQSGETAVVRDILVADGQFVRAGDVLVTLDDSITRAEVKRIHSELITARINKLRAEVLLEAVSSAQLPEITHYFPADLTDSQRQDAVRWIQGQYQEYLSQTAQTDASIEQTKAQEAEALAQLNKLTVLMPVTRRLTRDYQALAANHHLSEHEYLNQEQQRLAAQQEMEVQKVRIQILKAMQKTAESQKQSLKAQYIKSMLDLWQQAQSQIAVLEQEYIKAQEKQRRMTLKAPVSGTVQQLAIHTTGGVVTEAQALMVVVPADDPVVIEAWVANQDIGFLRPGLAAAVKVDTFNYTKYGLLNGKIRSISHDAIEDQQRGLIYSVIIELAEKKILTGDGYVDISPGMSVRAEIKTDQQRVIDYFLSPLKVYVSESLRER